MGLDLPALAKAERVRGHRELAGNERDALFRCAVSLARFPCEALPVLAFSGPRGLARLDTLGSLHASNESIMAQKENRPRCGFSSPRPRSSPMAAALKPKCTGRPPRDAPRPLLRNASGTSSLGTFPSQGKKGRMSIANRNRKGVRDVGSGGLGGSRAVVDGWRSSGAVPAEAWMSHSRQC